MIDELEFMIEWMRVSIYVSGLEYADQSKMGEMKICYYDKIECALEGVI